MSEKSVLFCCVFNNLDSVILESLSFIVFIDLVLCLVLGLVVVGNTYFHPYYQNISYFVVLCVHLELGKLKLCRCSCASCFATSYKYVA